MWKNKVPVQRNILASAVASWPPPREWLVLRARRPNVLIAGTSATTEAVVRTSIGGERFRIVLSNRFGTAAMRIDAVHLALRSIESAIVVSDGLPDGVEGLRQVTSVERTERDSVTIQSRS